MPAGPAHVSYPDLIVWRLSRLSVAIPIAAIAVASIVLWTRDDHRCVCASAAASHSPAHAMPVRAADGGRTG